MNKLRPNWSKHFLAFLCVCKLHLKHDKHLHRASGQHLTVINRGSKLQGCSVAQKPPLQCQSHALLLYLVSCREFGVQCRCGIARLTFPLQLKVSCVARLLLLAVPCRCLFLCVLDKRSYAGCQTENRSRRCSSRWRMFCRRPQRWRNCLQRPGMLRRLHSCATSWSSYTRKGLVCVRRKMYSCKLSKQVSTVSLSPLASSYIASTVK